MFDYNKMIKRAIEFFPHWTDIRKRYKTSNGGNLVSTILDESLKIEESIQAYIDYYFLDTYEGHENEIMAFSYMANIGIIKDLSRLSIYYRDKLLMITTDTRLFNEDKYNEYIYYEEGKLYIKESFYNAEYRLQVYIDDDLIEYDLVKYHVWNIFDEYAAFVNTRRYENETNKELLDRILYITRNLPNASEDGLKHAIISELMRFDKKISEADIKIERPTPENLRKPYENFEELLDKLMYINKDVLKCKKWDIDFWEYDFESISYIPHKWNETLKVWQNGIGHGKDLEVIVADDSDITNAELTLYNKSQKSFDKYIYNKDLKYDLNFQLIRYNNILNKNNIKYKLKASEVADITNEDIYLNLYESSIVSEERNADELYAFGKDLVEVDNSTIPESDSYRYRIKFDKIDNIPFNISQANVSYINLNTQRADDYKNLKVQQPGFILNSEKEIVSAYEKAIINSTESFSECEGFKSLDYNQGITLLEHTNSAIAKYPIKDLLGTYFSFNYKCDYVDMPISYLRAEGCYWNNDKEFVIRGDYSTENKKVSLEIEVNAFSFIVKSTKISGKVTATIIDGDSVETILLEPNQTVSIKETLKARKIKLIIDTLSFNDVVLGDFKYSNFNINITTKLGDIINLENGKYLIPRYSNNTLIIEMSAKSGIKPVLSDITFSSSMNSISYTTDFINAKTGCERKFEIRTTAKITLLKYDAYSNKLLETIENFNPCKTYHGSSTEAYMRLNVDDYDEIKEIRSDGGVIDLIEHYGKLYYNIKLGSGDTLSTIYITGKKSKPLKKVSLHDMVLYYIPDFNIINDKILCSKVSDNIIISRDNPNGVPYNTLVKLSSKMFSGIKVSKYELNTPMHIGSRYGSYNLESSDNKIRYQNFDYISFYPADGRIHEAINEYDSYMRENRNIPIVNNFSPEINSNKLMMYIVDNINEADKEKFIIRFHNINTENENIYNLDAWSIGASYIAIDNHIDLNNTINYNLNTYNINSRETLSSVIDIKDVYKLENDAILNTSQYIIKPPVGSTIKYEVYDGTENKKHLLKTEEIIIKSDRFNKLVYSNIDDIYNISLTPIGSQNKIDSNIKYTLLNEQGVIIWDNNLPIGTKLYIVYSIKKPSGFVFDLDLLYEIADYDVLAYNEIGKIQLNDIKDGEAFNLENLYKRYKMKDPDLVHISCTNPTFEGTIIENALQFNKYVEQNTILIKSGYYYINGREYFLYSKDENEEVLNNKYYSSENINIDNNEITTYKPTNNFIINSEMRLKGMAWLYNYNPVYKPTYGISNLKTLTACDSFNSWKFFNMQVNLVSGLNGAALQFTNRIKTSYAYLNITNYLYDDMMNYISLYATKNLKVYIAEEEKYQGINFNRELKMNLTISLDAIDSESEIRTVSFNKQSDINYYIVVMGYGIIDDILITNNSSDAVNGHSKNIDLLGLNLSEKKVIGSKYRMTIDTNKDYTPYEAGLMSSGVFKTTSNIDWYITKLCSFETEEDFFNCVLDNVDVEYTFVKTNKDAGSIMTPPIFIDDVNTIKKLIVKINDLEIDNMKGFNSVIYVSDKRDGEYIPLGNDYKNVFHIEKHQLKRYIRLKVNMPSEKIINNISIFAEYISTDKNPLKLITNNSGYVISKVYDFQDTLNYRLNDLSIEIDEESNINDIEIYIHTSRDTDKLEVWHDWRKIYLTKDLKLSEQIIFENIRFAQIKILIKSRNTSVKFNYLDVEVV